VTTAGGEAALLFLFFFFSAALTSETAAAAEAHCFPTTDLVVLRRATSVRGRSNVATLGLITCILVGLHRRIGFVKLQQTTCWRLVLVRPKLSLVLLSLFQGEVLGTTFEAHAPANRSTQLTSIAK
jgi:hypothetical protein